MDIRINVIQKVMEKLKGRVTNETAAIVQDILTLELNDYEINEKCTALSDIDNSAEGQLRKFIATKRIEGIADTTLKRYYDTNRQMLSFLNKPIYEITTFDLRFYLSYRRQTSGISNRSLDGMRRCYCSFFKWLTCEGILTKNPCMGLSQIKYKKTIKKPYSPTELEKLRKACDNIRDLAIVDFLYCTGCRVSEVSRLDISDINFDTLECTVVGKGNKERIVYLYPVAAMHLQEYLNTRNDYSSALFVGKGSDRLGKNGIESLLRRVGIQAKVENVHPHRFRRTLATNLLDRGMNIQDVAAILGHCDLKTTQIYCYISQSNIRAAYQKYAA